jgi:hypothetical protein
VKKEEKCEAAKMDENPVVALAEAFGPRRWPIEREVISMP